MTDKQRKALDDSVDSLRYLLEYFTKKQKPRRRFTRFRMALINGISALKKQIEMNPIDVTETKFNWLHGNCPICKTGITSRWDYCQNCGQCIDWRRAEHSMFMRSIYSEELIKSVTEEESKPLIWKRSKKNNEI